MFTICVNNHEEALTAHVGLKLDGGVLEETFVSCLATDALVLFCEGVHVQLAMYARSSSAFRFFSLLLSHTRGIDFRSLGTFPRFDSSLSLSSDDIN